MKIILQKVTVLAVFACVSHVFAATSQSFFRPRALSNDSGLEMALQNFQLYHNLHREKDYSYPKERSIVNLQSSYLYQESDNDTDLARYFLLGNKTELTIKQDGTGDIGSGWLNLRGATGTDYEVKFKIRPERTIYGNAINYHHDLSRLLKGLWHSIFIPVVHVEHDLNFSEFDQAGTAPNGTSDINDLTGVTTAAQAFNRSNQIYGKFSTVKRGKSGIDDMQWKLGWNFFRGEKFHWGLYSDFLIPLGTRSSAEYIFEPMVGGVHWGIGAGTNLDWQLLSSGSSKLSWQFDAKYRYLFSDVERRSFDLKDNGAWSRYLLMSNTSDFSMAFPAINFLTRDVDVTPRSTIDIFTALHYRYSSFHFEGGYNFWWRDSERVKLDGAFPSNLGIFDPEQGGLTASGAAISNRADGQGGSNAPTSDTTQALITVSDLDLESASHNSAASHKIFGAIALTSKFADSPTMIGVGAAYEFADRNTALDQWSIWLKTAISF